MRFKKANFLTLGQYQICSEHFEKFRALDTNPRKLSSGLLFVNKSVEREGAMLCIQESVDLPLCLKQNNVNRLYRNQAFRCHLRMQLTPQQNTKQMKQISDSMAVYYLPSTKITNIY